jgi:hypothetical protein
MRRIDSTMNKRHLNSRQLASLIVGQVMNPVRQFTVAYKGRANCSAKHGW